MAVGSLRMSARTLAVGVVSGLLVVAGAPAQAVGEGPPVLLSPGEGSTQPAGFSGPVVADLSGAPYGSYRADVSCDQYRYYESEWFTYADESQAQLSWTIPAISGFTDCRVVVSHTEKSWLSDAHAFFVEPEPLEFHDVTVTPQVFYPLVADGYRDEAVVSFQVDRTGWGAMAVVRDSAGVAVRVDELGYLRAGQGYTWWWNGGGDDGYYAAVGEYTVTLSAETNEGLVGSVSVPVRLATGWVSQRVTKSRPGTRGVAAARGACRVLRDADAGVATVDCWGGRFAQMTYTFPVPANATKVRWGVAGRLSSSDICCEGVVRRTGWMASRTRAKVRVRATGWRAFDVRRVSVSYLGRVRI